MLGTGRFVPKGKKGEKKFKKKEQTWFDSF